MNDKCAACGKALRPTYTVKAWTGLPPNATYTLFCTACWRNGIETAQEAR